MLKRACAVIALLVASSVCAQGAPIGEGAVAVVQAQVEAFNRGDVTAFADAYADDVELFDLGAEAKPNLVGRAALIARYDPVFRSKYHPQATVVTRIVSGSFVIDKERIAAGERAEEGVAIYQVEKGKIRRVWFTP